MGGGLKFDPAKDIPDLAGKVIFITGGTAGLGKESIIHLAKHNPAHIYFSGRNSKSADALISEIKTTLPDVNLTFVECDLASLSSIQNAAKQFNAACKRLDILMCNAGVMALPPQVTTDGYEVQFGTNHVGHALMIKLLLPALLRTAETPGSDVRIVSLTSLGFRGHPSGGIIFKDLRTVQDLGAGGAWFRYGQSKLANILYASELAKRYPQITSVSIHPGVVTTGLVGNLGFFNKALVYVSQFGRLLTPADGAKNQVWAATGDKANIVNGEFYIPTGQLGPHDKASKDENLAKDLWEWTQKELESYEV